MEEEEEAAEEEEVTVEVMVDIMATEGMVNQ